MVEQERKENEMKKRTEKRSIGGFTLCSSVVMKTVSSNISSNVVSNVIYDFDDDFTWFEVFRDVISHPAKNRKGEATFDVLKTDQICVSVAAKQNSVDVYHPDIDEEVSVIKNFDSSLKYVTFEVVRDDATDKISKGTPVERSGNVLTDMMQGRYGLKFPKPKEDRDSVKFTAKDKLYNDVCEHMRMSEAGFPKQMSDNEVAKHVSCIADALSGTAVATLWYIDGNLETINERAKHLPAVCPVPERFHKFQGYNDWKKKRKKKPLLHAKDLDIHSQILLRVANKPFVNLWNDLKRDIEALSVSLNTYRNFLNIANEKQQVRQLQFTPARQIAENVCIEHRLSTPSVDPKYSRLDSAMSEIGEYEPLFFEFEVHSSISISSASQPSTERHRFFQALSLSHDVVLLTYDPGGSFSALKVIWRVPPDVTSSELMTASARILQDIKSRIPEYHTRQMRREFSEKYCNTVGNRIPPHILRAIYSELTLDATADQNPLIDARVRQALLAEDPDLVVDLRHLNKGRPGDTFETFFHQLEREVDELTAADERRHNVEHMSKFVSVRDLIEQVSSKLPPETPVPSETTVLFAFVPRNAHANVAKLYKGRVPLRLSVQTRQLRASHPDDHYCAAQFKYMRHFAVKYRDSVQFVCVDDKSKLDFGEPGTALSSGVRGKKSIVPSTSTLSCLDHDVGKKGSLTPSVCLNVDVPQTKEETFYRGEVSVIFKDSIFQPSSPFRHGVELQKILEEKGDVKPVLMIFSDGGPDHRVTYHAVKISLIILFRRLGLDMLIAGRTAPGHSWVNPAERIMSLLNLAFQNAALSRNERNSAIEQVIRSCNSMEEIRKKAKTVPELETEWIDSLQMMIAMLEERVCRVHLKGKKFKCLSSAAREDVISYEDEIANIDPELIQGQYQQVHVGKKQMYIDFLKNHCLERTYTFQVRKCNDASCCVPPRVQIPWLPDPVLSQDSQHFKDLEQLLGVPTTEKDCPTSSKVSLASVAEDQQGCKNSVLVGQNVRLAIGCMECNKPRCVYSKNSLTSRETRAFKRLLESYDYTCGSLLTPDGHALQGKLFVRLQLCCQSPVEFAYYSCAAPNIGRKDICCHCGVVGAQRDRDLKTVYKIVLPVCDRCKHLGTPKRNPIKK